MGPGDEPRAGSVTQLEGSDVARGRKVASHVLRAAACQAAPDYLDDVEPDEPDEQGDVAACGQTAGWRSSGF